MKRWHKIALGSGSAVAIACSVAAAYEGLRLHTYGDVGGVSTICYGHTQGVKPGQTATKAQCFTYLKSDMDKADAGVHGCIHRPMTKGQEVAFADLAYNIGVSRFCSSSIARRFNAGDAPGACAAIRWYVYAAGHKEPLPGLVKRRDVEYQFCMGENT